jgi:methylthioribulose-1-phosphate dehydratase
MFTPPEPAQRVSDLCRDLYALGWASGTGGGFSLRQGERVFMAPSGVQKERVVAEDVFELDLEGRVTVRPANAALKLSECAPLFLHAFQLRNAGAALHSHGMYAMLASLTAGETFECTELEMIKGIAGHGYHDRLVVPIIENTAHEHELADRMADAMRAHPRTQAVLVRRHGVYVWGRDWVQAKTQAECYHYLFEASVRMAALGIDAARPTHLPDLGLVGGGAK